MSGGGYGHPDLRVCAVCGRVLARAGDSGWLHLDDALQGTEDHIVVPVLPGEVYTVGFCDFCHELDPGFVVPVRDFDYSHTPNLVTPDGVSRRSGSLGDWSACKTCATLIERNDWNGVVRRVVTKDDRAKCPEIETAIRRQYRQVRANITGPVRPLDWPQPEERKQTVTDMPEEILTELHARRTAHTNGDPQQWAAFEQWLTQSLALARPGGVVSMVAPDGKPFAIRRPHR